MEPPNIRKVYVIKLVHSVAPSMLEDSLCRHCPRIVAQHVGIIDVSAHLHQRLDDQVMSRLGRRHQRAESPAARLQRVRVGTEPQEQLDEVGVPVDYGEEERGVAVVVRQPQQVLLGTCRMQLAQEKRRDVIT